MSETARQNDGIRAGEVAVLVPDELGLFAEHLSRGIPGIAIRIRARKHNHRKLHGVTP
jgi:hypothetical protein